MGKDIQSRRDFLRHAVMLAGAGVTAPLWAAMKFDRDAVLRHFRANAASTAWGCRRTPSGART